MVRKILKFFLYLIIAFVCLVILQFAYSKYEDFKNPPPTPEERIKTKERNERLYSCLRDNIETSFKLKNTECEAYADGAKIDFNDNSGKKDIIKNLKSKDYADRYDNYVQRYDKCYTEMTVAHSRRGLLKSNIELSSNVRRGICKAYAKGEEINYEGKR